MNKQDINIKPIFDLGKPLLFIETYGCQMNVNDSEVVLSIMQKSGYVLTEKVENADLIFINTCSIRDNAEQRIWGRLNHLKGLKKRNKNLRVGILGCMAERLKEELLENQAVDLVVGPDSYRELPKLVSEITPQNKQINVLLSQEETYADISPVRMDKNGVSGFISIMRGCNNMCTYCVVPYVRGAERSRDPKTIIREANELFNAGYREVTLLGQNVDSYRWADPDNPSNVMTFANLLVEVAQVNSLLRVRFSTSHPKDMDDSVLYAMAAYPNICKHIHLPIQSGSDKILEKMNRKYNRKDYMQRIEMIRQIVPECSISTDIIAGFCSEDDEDHKHTLSAMKEVGYFQAFMFQYSQRPNTKAARHYPDDVPEEIKNKRLNEIIELQNELSLLSNQVELGKTFEVLAEGYSKRSKSELLGRTSQNKVCIFPADGSKVGDYVKVRIESCSSATLKGIKI